MFKSLNLARIVKFTYYCNWNLHLLTSLCELTSDREVVQFLTFGWPVSHDNRTPLTITTDNHTSAKNNSQHITRYILKELSHKTLIGPLASLPF